MVEKGPTARLEIFRINSLASPPVPRTWGVRTLDFIPRYGFVCEVAGQYVHGRSPDEHAGQPSVADALLRDPAVRPDSAAGTSAKYTPRIMPVEAWDDALTVGDACEDPIAWALRQECATATVTADRDCDSFSGARQPTVTELLQAEESYEQVQRFLQGQICVSAAGMHRIVGLPSTSRT